MHEQIVLGAQLLTVRFGSTPDGRPIPVALSDLKFISQHLDAEELSSIDWPDLPYRGGQLVVADCAGPSLQRTRYAFAWGKSRVPDLTVHRESEKLRSRLTFVACGLGTWVAAAEYHVNPIWQTDEPDPQSDTEQLSDVIKSMRLQGHLADTGHRRKLHNTGLGVLNGDVGSPGALSLRPRFVQLPTGLLATSQK